MQILALMWRNKLLVLSCPKNLLNQTKKGAKVKIRSPLSNGHFDSKIEPLMSAFVKSVLLATYDQASNEFSTGKLTSYWRESFDNENFNSKSIENKWLTSFSSGSE